MPDAIEVQIADRLIADITAGSWTQSFTGSRGWLPVLDESALATLQVRVIPLTLETSRLAKASRFCKYGFELSILKFVDPSVTADLDALSRFTEELHDWLENLGNSGVRHLSSPLTAWWIDSAERPEIVIEDVLNLHNLWWSYLNIEVRNQRY